MHANEPEMADRWEKKKKKEALSASQAKAAHDKFKKTGELPPHLKKLVKKIKKFEKNADVKNIVVPGLEWMSKIKESDLGLTYKKGKTVKVKHKTSGKSLVIIDKPNVRKEYEKIGFFAESVNEGSNQMTQVYKDLDNKLKKYDHTRTQDFNKVSKYLKTKFSKGSYLPDTIASFYNDYKGGEDMKKNINRLTKYAKKMKGYKKESVTEAKRIKIGQKVIVKKLPSYVSSKLKGKDGKIYAVGQDHYVVHIPPGPNYVVLLDKDIEVKESVKEADRDYKDEYKKFQSSTKSKKYRAELNKYNRKKGTYGNGDGKDASHKNGKIAGFESQSKNRGRAEKSRLKKEETTRQEIEEYVDGILDGMGEEFMVNEGMTKYNIRLTKTPGWYGIWDKNGKQKAEGDKKYITKFLKSLKTRMGNFAIKSLVDVATDKKGKDISFDVVESINEIRKFHPKKLGDNYLGGFNSPKGDTEMFGDKKGNFYIWVKPKGKKERYIDLPKNIKDRSKADVFHKKIQKTMGESVEEGFGGDLKGSDKKKFEKGRKDNSEQLGYKLTGTSDIKESVDEGSCGYGIDGKLGSQPAGPHLLKKKKKKDEVSLGGRISKKIGKHGGTRNKAEVEKIIKYFMKKGDTKKTALDKIEQNYDYVSKKYRTASVSKKAEILTSLQESVNEGLNSKGFSIINQSIKTMAINFRDLQKLVKKQSL